VPRGPAPTRGVAVYRRGATWFYRIDIEADPVTGKRRRENRGGYDTEGEAWSAALESRRQQQGGRRIDQSRRTVAQFFDEWLTSVSTSVKPSTLQNYTDYLRAYVLPAMGHRQLRDVTVPMLNVFYGRLVTEGRIKTDASSVMFAYWHPRRDERGGRGPTPAAVAAACGVSIHAARAAVTRFRAGREPAATSPGLAPKTVRNVHRLLHRAFGDAVTWQYLAQNPADHARLPRQGRSRQTRPQPWTIDELTEWLRVAASDRFAAIWMVAATTGMRRSELAGAARVDLDLDKATLRVAATRVVVDGRTVDSDGKTDSGVRTLSLDPGTVELLRRYLDVLDEEREAFGTGYRGDHGKLMRYEDGRAVHADSITRRFNRLVDKAGVRRIRLHDVRHSYATLLLDIGVQPKIVSDRMGHANMSVTFQIYGHRSTGRDREAADLVGGLIHRETARIEPS
jgi:integrase